jgi:hypothetical protein
MRKNGLTDFKKAEPAHGSHQQALTLIGPLECSDAQFFVPAELSSG